MWSGLCVCGEGWGGGMYGVSGAKGLWDTGGGVEGSTPCGDSFCWEGGACMVSLVSVVIGTLWQLQGGGGEGRWVRCVFSGGEKQEAKMHSTTTHPQTHNLSTPIQDTHTHTQ